MVTDINKQLENFHHRLAKNLHPLGYMLTKRKFSPKTLLEIADELQDIAKEMKKLCQ